MLHYVAHAAPGTRLFDTAEEAVALWRLVERHLTGLVAIYLMPNHLHLQHRREVDDALTRVMWSFSRWRSAHRGVREPVWAPRPEPHRLVGRQKERRSERYILLNGCRAGLEHDPLAWAFSSHRDTLGFAARPVRGRVPDPLRHHAWVSSDPTADPNGTPFPLSVHGELRADVLPSLQGAVSEYLRVPLSALARRGRARTLFLQAACTLTVAAPTQIGDLVGVSARTIRRVPTGRSPAVDVLSVMLEDPRFPGIDDQAIQRRRRRDAHGSL